jgi:hypothetical protein
MLQTDAIFFLLQCVLMHRYSCVQFWTSPIHGDDDNRRWVMHSRTRINTGVTYWWGSEGVPWLPHQKATPASILFPRQVVYIWAICNSLLSWFWWVERCSDLFFALIMYMFFWSAQGGCYEAFTHQWSSAWKFLPAFWSCNLCIHTFIFLWLYYCLCNTFI